MAFGCGESGCFVPTAPFFFFFDWTGEPSVACLGASVSRESVLRDSTFLALFGDLPFGDFGDLTVVQGDLRKRFPAGGGPS